MLNAILIIGGLAVAVSVGGVYGGGAFVVLVLVVMSGGGPSGGGGTWRGGTALG